MQISNITGYDLRAAEYVHLMHRTLGLKQLLPSTQLLTIPTILTKEMAF